MWVEQSYKQVKHALGWSQYQVRSDLAIRRHWQLVCCAFSFCWWAWPSRRGPHDLGSPPAGRPRRGCESSSTGFHNGGGGVWGEKGRLLDGAPVCSWPQALRKVSAWLQPYVMLLRYWRAYTDLHPPEDLEALLDRLFSARGSTSMSISNKLPLRRFSKRMSHCAGGE